MNLSRSKLATLGGALAALGISLLLASCGASFQSGVSAPTPSSKPVSAATPSPSGSPSSCVNPATKAAYTLAGARLLSGNLQVKDIKVGTGTAAAVGSTVSVSYVGTLPNGTVFDSSSVDNHGKPVSLTIAAGKVIQGWVEGIPGMRVGGVRELVIPAALGYGCQTPSPKLPVNSTLIFTITLVSVS
ncbi:MAG: FKBP-type peptidyl-prolyl cis-trans isomerase [Candidatus Dormibacteria bacterium]